MYCNIPNSSSAKLFFNNNTKVAQLKLFEIPTQIWCAFLLAQSVQNLPAMKETWIRFLGGEDPLEKKTVTHSSILAWKIPWTEEPGGLQSMGSQSQTQLSD